MFQSLKQKAIRDGKWKYLQNEQGEHLFDLSIDPSEKNNLKDGFPDVFEKLRGKYAAWEKTVLTPIPL
jgi:arylsulfatase A-like enzyme